ncbi:unnamed protein product, partial [Nesidiocoris tenuis]
MVEGKHPKENYPRYDYGEGHKGIEVSIDLRLSYGGVWWALAGRRNTTRRIFNGDKRVGEGEVRK